MSKILIIGNNLDQLLNFRGDLIRHLQQLGHKVITASPAGPKEVDARLASWGVRRLDLRMDRTGVSIAADLRLLRQMRRMMREERPDAILAYTIKPVIYGALAARMAGSPPIVSMITGLGAVFLSPANAKGKLVRFFALTLYRWAMRRTNVVVFQNPDDEIEFRRLGLLTGSQRVERTSGSGVHLERYPATPLPSGPMRFLMIARLIADKGVREYIAAAAQVRVRHPDVTFHLVGPHDPNPSSLRPEEVQAAVASGTIVHHGFAQDVRPHLNACHAYVLPSYREGTPRSVLEAMAVARPVITTDAPGCRETVVEGVNGLMVPVRDAGALAQAMLKLTALPPSALAAMGLASRQLAETRFDVRMVNAQLSGILAQEIQRSASSTGEPVSAGGRHSDPST